MLPSSAKPAFLILADGTFFEGKGFGYIGKAIGEVVFNTGITGYQEVLTDPSYFGQLVTFTYPEIGNTGINSHDQEAPHPSVKGVIVREFAEDPSNWRSNQSFENWLKEEKVVGISGLDTRALVRHIREVGAMNGIICTDSEASPFKLLEEIKSVPLMEGLNLVEKVTTDVSYLWN